MILLEAQPASLNKGQFHIFIDQQKRVGFNWLKKNANFTDVPWY